MKNKLDTKSLLCGLVLGAVVVLAIGATSPADHEAASKTRYSDMQDRLTKCVATGDRSDLSLLTAQLETQLKLEDFLIRFREADHAKTMMWSTVFLSSIVSVLTTLLTMRARKG
jgi:hypothetical protein